MDPPNDQPSVGLRTQLVEHCICTTKNRVQFRPGLKSSGISFAEMVIPVRIICTQNCFNVQFEYMNFMYS